MYLVNTTLSTLLRAGISPTSRLSTRDKAIIAFALLHCSTAELGDYVGGHDAKTRKRVIQLAACFDLEQTDRHIRCARYARVKP